MGDDACPRDLGLAWAPAGGMEKSLHSHLPHAQSLVPTFEFVVEAT
jgi:hypothetical protein